MVSGAIRTDLILSAEIMAIALSEVTDQIWWQQALILALIGIIITAQAFTKRSSLSNHRPPQRAMFTISSS